MPNTFYPEVQPLLYTAIGDSLTVGKGSGLFSPGFVERFANELGRFRSQFTHTQKFAKNGATSEVIYSLTQLPPIAQVLKDSNLITLTSGGNDLIDGGKAFLRTRDDRDIEQAIGRALTNNWRIVYFIDQLHQTNPMKGPIYLLNMYNPFPSIPEAYKGIRTYNDELERLSAIPNVRVVDIYSAFQGRQSLLLSHDGVHPNSEGYQVIADTLLTKFVYEERIKVH